MDGPTHQRDSFRLVYWAVAVYGILQNSKAVTYLEQEQISLTHKEQQDALELIAQLAEGDETAIGPLYDIFGVRVYALAYKITRDHETAEEVTQEVFVRVWRNAASFQPEKANPQTWILRIAHNAALNEVRKRQSRPINAQLDVTVTENLQADTSDEANPELSAINDEQAQLVRRAMAVLNEQQKQTIELAYFGGMSHSEIAAALGDPIGTIKSRIRLGMQKMRQFLIDEGRLTTAIHDSGSDCGA